MKDITAKIETARTATARCVVSVPNDIAPVLERGEVEKGNLYEVSRTAAMIALKKTYEVIPHCHPLLIDQGEVNFEVDANKVIVLCTVKTCFKTGCEMEALYGASIAALTIYDMLKPLTGSVRISELELTSKTGGKSDFCDVDPTNLKAAVIVASDSVFAGKKEDKAGRAVYKILKGFGVMVEPPKIIPDEEDQIASAVKDYCNEGFNMVIVSGGTGLSPRDRTPEAIAPLLDVEIPGIMEAARAYGQRRTPYSMLSRGIAGLRGDTLILAIPGSSRGAKETMEALFPYLFHIFKVKAGLRHD